MRAYRLPPGLQLGLAFGLRGPSRRLPALLLNGLKLLVTSEQDAARPEHGLAALPELPCHLLPAGLDVSDGAPAVGDTAAEILLRQPRRLPRNRPA
jgi:hypothetical protein